MPKRHPSQHKGGRSLDGSPAKAENPKRNAGHGLSVEVIEAIAALPQIKSGEWSKSYLSEQLWRNYLGLASDYELSDLDLIVEGAIVE